MRKCILFIFMLSCACNVFGQKERSVNIYATIQDYILRTTIEDVKVTLLSPDSVALDSCLNDNGYITLRKLYRFNVKEGNYIIKTEKEGYETTYTPIEVSDIRRRETNRVLSTIYMKRPKVHAIDEVVVTATKVKFYNKGDTVVYNADAFQLAEGSMLDALVKQLPGVELKSDGRISHTPCRRVRHTTPAEEGGAQHQHAGTCGAFLQHSSAVCAPARHIQIQRLS